MVQDPGRGHVQVFQAGDVVLCRKVGFLEPAAFDAYNAVLRRLGAPPRAHHYYRLEAGEGLDLCKRLQLAGVPVGLWERTEGLTPGEFRLLTILLMVSRPTEDGLLRTEAKRGALAAMCGVGVGAVRITLRALIRKGFVSKPATKDNPITIHPSGDGPRVIRPRGVIHRAPQSRSADHGRGALEITPLFSLRRPTPSPARVHGPHAVPPSHAAPDRPAASDGCAVETRGGPAACGLRAVASAPDHPPVEITPRGAPSASAPDRPTAGDGFAVETRGGPAACGLRAAEPVATDESEASGAALWNRIRRLIGRRPGPAISAHLDALHCEAADGGVIRLQALGAAVEAEALAELGATIEQVAQLLTAGQVWRLEWVPADLARCA